MKVKESKVPFLKRRKKEKIPFFKRMKDSVINFDKYLDFTEEKVSIAIKYIFKLVLVFSFIVGTVLASSVFYQSKNMIGSLKNEIPEFSVENGILEFKGEDKRIIKNDENGYFSIVVDNQGYSLDEIVETNNYQIVIGALKDRIVLKDTQGLQSIITYKQIGEQYDLANANKEELFKTVEEKIASILYPIMVIIPISLYIVYLLRIFMDIILLSIVAYLLSRIMNLKLKYKSTFNISAYAITLPVILFAIYISINIFTGFTIKYFEVAYNAIAYIYLITAMLMIKSDLIKQQIEVGKIVEEQKKVREEKKKEDSKKQDKKEEKPKKEKKEKKENKKEEGTPEGNQA